MRVLSTLPCAICIDTHRVILVRCALMLIKSSYTNVHCQFFIEDWAAASRATLSMMYGMLSGSGIVSYMQYKRGGQRVHINFFGDMIVRPTAVETSLQLTPGGSVRSVSCTSRGTFSSLCPSPGYLLRTVMRIPCKRS
jgi:hypothetical protein